MAIAMLRIAVFDKSIQVKRVSRSRNETKRWPGRTAVIFLSENNKHQKKEMRHKTIMIFFLEKKEFPVKVWRVRSTFPGEERKYPVHAYLARPKAY